MRELPISNERLEELAAGLSDEARAILDRWIMAAQLHATYEEDEPDETHLGLALVGFGELPRSEQERIRSINEELRKAYDRRIREDEAVVALSKAAQEIFYRAAELDDSLTEESTLGDAIKVLKAHGGSSRSYSQKRYARASDHCAS